MLSTSVRSFPGNGGLAPPSKWIQLISGKSVVQVDANAYVRMFEKIMLEREKAKAEQDKLRKKIFDLEDELQNLRYEKRMQIKALKDKVQMKNEEKQGLLRDIEKEIAVRMEHGNRISSLQRELDNQKKYTRGLIYRFHSAQEETEHMVKKNELLEEEIIMLRMKSSQDDLYSIDQKLNKKKRKCEAKRMSFKEISLKIQLFDARFQECEQEFHATLRAQDENSLNEGDGTYKRKRTDPESSSHCADPSAKRLRYSSKETSSPVEEKADGLHRSLPMPIIHENVVEARADNNSSDTEGNKCHKRRSNRRSNRGLCHDAFTIHSSS